MVSELLIIEWSGCARGVEIPSGFHGGSSGDKHDGGVASLKGARAVPPKLRIL